jgi:hypothetical protein
MKESWQASTRMSGRAAEEPVAAAVAALNTVDLLAPDTMMGLQAGRQAAGKTDGQREIAGHRHT